MSMHTRHLSIDSSGRVWYRPEPDRDEDDGDDIEAPARVYLGLIDRLEVDDAPRGVEAELEELLDDWRSSDDQRDLDREANAWYNATRGVP